MRVITPATLLLAFDAYRRESARETERSGERDDDGKTCVSAVLARQSQRRAATGG
jgi:hypothetical protein